MTRLEGKTVLITGAGSGIGEAAALAFAAAGGRIVLNGRREGEPRRAAERIAQPAGRRSC